MTTTRSLSTIAEDVRLHWSTVYFGAVPYLDAMGALDTIDDYYGYDSAVGIVLRFLENARRWKGPDAVRVKAELQSLVALAKPQRVN